jgi:hypothetical protein
MNIRKIIGGSQMFKKLILTALVTALALAGAASAATFTWQGDVDPNWFTPANWDVGVGLPVNGATGDVVMIRGVTLPNVNPNVSQPGALYQQLYIESDGILDVSGGNTTTYGTLGSGSSYNQISDGTWNMLAGGTSNMAQNLYVGHTDTAGSLAYMNIYSGGLMRTGGVLTMGGRRGHGEMYIYGGGTYNLFNNIRWNYLTAAGLTETSFIKIYSGAVWNWTLDRVSTDEVGWAVRNNRIVAGDPGFEVVATYDSTANSTLIRTIRYTRAYLPTYNPALFNDAVNVNVANLSTPTGTIDLGWTKPEPSNPSMPIQSTVYFGTANPPTTAIATSIPGNSVTGVAIDKLQNYYWKVDSYDPNKLAAYLADPNFPNPLSPGDVWSFNTQNLAPITSAQTSPVRIWLVSGSANTTLNGTAVDDGYPLPSPTLTYTWTQTDTTKDVLATPAVGADVTLYFGSTGVTNYVPQTRNFSVVCNDGLATGPAYAVSVTVYNTACLAGQAANGVTVGDVYPLAVTSGSVTVVGDCMVNFKDFARLALDWMKCKTTDGICPL